MDKPSAKLTLALVTFLSVLILPCLYSLMNSTRQYPSYDTVSRRPPKLVVTYKILIYNPAYWINVAQLKISLTTCSFRNCEISTDRGNLRNYSAIIYVLTEAPKLPPEPPINVSERNPDQVWIASWVEAPARHSGYYPVYRNPKWRATLNWTMSYTLDAEVYYPYGAITLEKHPPSKNYTKIFHRKSKMAAWVVSNCHTQSRRMQYVSALRKQGIEVDMFGRCAGKRTDNVALRNLITQKYKFYLAFENSFCKDYITEKFFSYRELDAVPVVRGAGNYSRFAPKDTYINTAEFSSVRTLADYLRYLSKTAEAYTEHLMNKDKYVSVSPQLARMNSICMLCEKLNDINKYRAVIQDYGKHVNQCYSPTDLK